MKFASLSIVVILLGAVFVVISQAAAPSVSYVGFSGVVKPIYLAKGYSLVVENSRLTVNGSVTGAGLNGLTLINSTVTASTVQLKGPAVATILNSSIVGLSKPVVLDTLTTSINGLSLQAGKMVDCDLLTLRRVNNTVLDNISLGYNHSYRYTAAIAIRCEGCVNLVLNHVSGVGVVDVDTPHWWVVWTGPGATVGGVKVNTLLSTNLVVENSVFYGGGNGVAGGAVTWRNDTFSNIVDGTEWWYKGNTQIIGCVFRGCSEAEINLQNSYTLSQGSLQLYFTNCSFNKGLVNMDAGYAKLVGCTFSNGFVPKDMGDNSGSAKYAGVVDWGGVRLSWSGKNIKVSAAP